jgi:hypothetical protein
MLPKFIICLCLFGLFACGRTIEEPAHTTYTRITNGLKGPVSIELYQKGVIVKTHALNHNQSFEVSSGPLDGPKNPLADFDSLNIWFASTVVKTDINCDKLPATGVKHTECLADIVSLFLTDDYGQDVLENASRWKYTIDVKDSVEAK